LQPFAFNAHNNPRKELPPSGEINNHEVEQGEGSLHERESQTSSGNNNILAIDLPQPWRCLALMGQTGVQSHSESTLIRFLNNTIIPLITGADRLEGLPARNPAQACRVPNRAVTGNEFSITEALLDRV
jgi:hypothetical protein